MTMTAKELLSTQQPFPLLPLRKGVLFPGTVLTLPIGRERSVELVRSLSQGQIIGVAVQRDAKVHNPYPADLHPIGTLGRIHRVVRTERQGYRLIIEGLERFKLGTLVASEPFWTTLGEALPDSEDDPTQNRLYADALIGYVNELSSSSGGSLAKSIGDTQEPSLLADRVAAGLSLSPEDETRVLLTLPTSDRLRIVSELLNTQRERSQLKQKIEAEVRRKVSKSQREHLLREHLKAIHKELGDDPEDVNEVDKIRQSLDEAELPEEVDKVAQREYRRLKAMQPGQAEYNVIRNYLEWILALPWNERAEVSDDLDKVAEQLDADHFGLQDVKQRILEHMAVMKLSGTSRGSILCLAGPPGVGKTSLGQSIADATGRPFVRISLGGVRDEAEMRGHRRTYIGALPGRIIHALRKAGARNPVMLLDEVDKLGRSWNGTPEDALLEILDPEQNSTFQDHYMELPFDLSEVLFICTANFLENLSPPLRDRLEIIELSGYTPDEKQQIARKHLVPKQLERHSIAEESLSISDEGLTRVITEYTREAGVRQLEREITKLCRTLALMVARSKEETPPTLHVETEDVPTHLGKQKYFSEAAERTALPGVATGLAWTPVGGDILFIETTSMPGKGRIEITGKLGDVMKESARAALTFVRSNAEALDVDPDFLEEHDIHIHVPAGAVPKDGPSAGVTIFTALTSLLTGKRVRSDTAMTGECTLRGRVLPVGGIKAKVLAAHRAGITRVILPERNRRDLDDVPEAIREELEVFFASDMHQVLEKALVDTDATPDLALEPHAASDPNPIAN